MFTELYELYEFHQNISRKFVESIKN